MLYVNTSPYSSTFDVAYSICTLTYNDIPVYVFAYEATDDEPAETDYYFFLKSSDNDYYLCQIVTPAYNTHEEDQELPDDIAKYIDALTSYKNDVEMEVAEYPDIS